MRMQTRTIGRLMSPHVVTLNPKTEDEPLTPREQEAATKLSEGLEIKEIAHEMDESATAVIAFEIDRDLYDYLLRALCPVTPNAFFEGYVRDHAAHIRSEAAWAGIYGGVEGVTHE